MISPYSEVLSFEVPPSGGNTGFKSVAEARQRMTSSRVKRGRGLSRTVRDAIRFGFHRTSSKSQRPA